MVETIFPPAPNFYLAKIISAREDGILAYGSQNCIFVFKYDDNQIHPIILRVHNEKVTSVAFSPLKCHVKLQNSVMSSSEDGYVKICSIETLTPIMGHNSHGEQKEKIKVVCAAWSQCNPQYIISAAENSTLVLWDAIGNITTTFYFQKLKPTVMECSYHDERVVACGSMNGLIYIVKLINKGEIIHKLRGHDKEVQALSWCPMSQGCDPFKQFLLASSCQENEIYIWRALDGVCETKIPLPKNVSSRTGDQGKLDKYNNFTPLFWPEPYTIYSGTKCGELISCDLKDFLGMNAKNGDMNEKEFKRKISSCWNLIHSFHSSILMGIVGFHTGNKAISIVEPDPGNAAENKLLESNNGTHTHSDCSSDVEESRSIVQKDLIWTLGKDRKLIAVDRNSKNHQPRFNFHTLNGHPYYAAISPHDPNKIAIAVGDGKIRLWSAARHSGETHVYGQKINDRVYALGWHPTREGLLAFGTSEGRIGLIDMYTSKPVTHFKVHHHGVVYRLSWGPPFSENGESSTVEKREYCLYSVGNNNVFLNDPTKTNSEALNLSHVLDVPYKKFSDLSWKPDYSLLALGCTNGTVCLLQPPKLTTLRVILCCKKYIQSLVWHPVTTTIDTDCSSFQGYFTFGTTDTESIIKVYNCSVNDNCTVEQIAALKGHSDFVQSVSWSPHIGGRLISASADYSVRIWDVTRNMQIAKYVVSNSVLPLFCIWSPIDPDVVITGTSERLACTWRISASSNNSPVIKNFILTKRKPKNIMMTESQSSVGTYAEKNHQTGRRDAELGNMELNNLVLANQNQKIVKESKMFTKAWKSDKDPFQHCYNLLKMDKNGEDDVNHIFPLLGTEDQFLQFLNSEAESCQNSNKWNEYYEMSLWRGNLNEVLEEKIKTGHLDDFLVSLAPFASPRLWREACLHYAKSLSEKKLYRKAACYLMAVHEVRTAIELLLKADLYLEAISIARCRLPESDPAYTDAIRKYADWLSKTGSLLKACECYIFLNDYAEAAAILGKKNHIDYLSLTALASKKAGLESLERENALSALLMALESHNWDLADRISNDHQNLKELSILNTIHSEINRLDVGEIILEKDLINHMCEKIGSRGDLTIYSSLEYIYDKNFICFDKKKFHVTLARELALACCAVKEEILLTHIIRSMNAASRCMSKSNDGTSPLYKLCSWLCSNEYLVEGNIFCLNNGNAQPKITSLRAFLCQGVVEYIDNVYSKNNGDVCDRLLDMELILSKLVNDGLDREAFIYFKNRLDVISCEKAINEAYKKKNGLMTGKSDDSDLEKSVDRTGEPTGKSDQEEESEKNVDLDELISSEKEKMYRLKEEIKDFENSRIIAPNPALLYCILRRVADESRNTQCNLKQIVEEKWKELET